MDLSSQFNYYDNINGLYANSLKKWFNDQNKKCIYISSNCIKWCQFLFNIINLDNYHITNLNNADITIQHICDDYVQYYNKFNIIISGESGWDLKFQPDLLISTSFYDQNQCKNHIYIPHMYMSLCEHRKSINPSNYPNNRFNFCAYMYSVDVEHRIKYFNLLSFYKTVHALGASCKNTDIPITRDINDENITYNDIAIDIYTNFKFVLSLENKNKDGYFTEKIINPIIANSVPIYWGNDKIFEYINKKRVIYINDFESDQKLLEYIAYLDNNEEEYEKIVHEPIFTEKGNIENFKNSVKNQLSKFL